MDEAIRLAALGPHSSNPRVGAVCVFDGVVVGVGFHHGAGTPHAEVEALAAAGDCPLNKYMPAPAAAIPPSCASIICHHAQFVLIM